MRCVAIVLSILLWATTGVAEDGEENARKQELQELLGKLKSEPFAP